MIRDERDGMYYIIVRRESTELILLSKQHKCLVDIDKVSLLMFGLLLPLGRFIDDDTSPILLSVYNLLLGIFFGRSSNLVVFNLLTHLPELLFMAYFVWMVLFLIHT